MRSKADGKQYPYLWAVLYGLFLTGYAAFTLLDAFVLPKDMVYMEDMTGAPPAMEDDGSEQYDKGLDSGAEEAESSDEAAEPEPEETTEPIVTDTSYESAGISITITTQRADDTQIYIADVVIEDISYLRAGLAGDAFGRNVKETTSAMAEENDAVLAINGDYYGFRDKGYVMRNGYLYRETKRTSGDDEALVIYQDGHMEIVNENDGDAQELAQNAVQIFSFGPGLICEGEIMVDESSEVEQAMRSNPRTAIGEIAPLHYIFVVSDGRTQESEGLTLLELAQVMQEQGCETAYNLDGGGSSTMWFMGRIVNQPTSGWRSGERSVSDIVYIGE